MKNQPSDHIDALSGATNHLNACPMPRVDINRILHRTISIRRSFARKSQIQPQEYTPSASTTGQASGSRDLRHDATITTRTIRKSGVASRDVDVLVAECVAAGDRDGVDRGFHAYETSELVRERRQWLAMESMSVLGRWHSNLIALCSTYEVDVDWESSLSSGSDGEAGEDSPLTLSVRSSSDASGAQTMVGEANGVAKLSDVSSAISSD